MPIHEVGEWFSTTAQSIADQDYPDLSVTVVHDRGIESLIAGHVEILDAELVAVDPSVGFGERINAAVALAEEPLILICHDDVALDVGTVSVLVRELRRRGAAPVIVAPKLVDWNDSTRLVPAGFEADRFGETTAIVRPGDLDQGQQDRFADVFGTSTACLLTSREFFISIGGFDPVIDWHGEAHDLALRSRLAGATVVLSSSVGARHRAAFSEREGPSEVLRLRRHQMRSILATTSGIELALVLGSYVLLHIVEFVIAVVRLDLGEVRSIPSAWLWNLQNFGSLVSRRKFAHDSRVVQSDELRAMRRRGSIRLTDSVDRRLSQRERASEQGETTLSITRVASAVVLGVIVAFGARHLVFGSIPVIGEFRLLPDDLGTLTADWWNGWRNGGVGSEGFAPMAYPLLDVAGVATLGSAGFLRALLILVPLPIGVIGAWSLFSSTSSERAPVAAALLYAASPLPYNAINGGSLQALLLYASLPWILGHLISVSNSELFERRGRRSVSVVGLIALLSIVGAVSPWVGVAFAVVLVGIVLGAFLSGDMRGVVPLLGVGAAALVGAVILNLPYLIGIRTWSLFGTPGSTTGNDVSLAELLTFTTGVSGSTALGWAIFAPALFPLLIGRGQRFSWAMRSWGIMLVAWGLAWASIRGWLPLATPALEVMLAPAALGVAVLGGVGALVVDRQVSEERPATIALAAIATIGMCIATLPLVQSAVHGRWELARTDLTTTFQAIEDPVEEGTYRVLWIGDSHVLGAASLPTANELAWTSSINGAPDIRALWEMSDGPATDVLTDSITAGIDGRTSRLGRELSRFGVRYIVVVDQQAPRPEPSRAEPVSAGRAAGFASQLDLVRSGFVVNPAIVVYENTAWAPVHTAVAPAALETVRLDDPAPAVVQQSGPASWTGQIRVSRSIYAAWEPADRWVLRVDDEVMPRIDLGIVGMGFDTSSAGDATAATFIFETSDTHRLVLGAQIAAWLILTFLRRWIVGRERREVRLTSARLERAS